jgi:hypothetical protein
MGDTLISTTCGLRDAVPSVLNLLLHSPNRNALLVVSALSLPVALSVSVCVPLPLRGVGCPLSCEHIALHKRASRMLGEPFAPWPWMRRFACSRITR